MPARFALLAQHGCSIAHCPSSNLKLASGIAPISALKRKRRQHRLGQRRRGQQQPPRPVAEMRLAALLAKGSSGRAEAIGAHQALRMATLGGAQALGLDAETGSLAPAKAADLCAVRNQ